MDPFHLIYRHLDERAEVMRDHVASGAPRSYEEYREAVGALREIERMLAEVKDIEQRFVADE